MIIWILAIFLFALDKLSTFFNLSSKKNGENDMSHRSGEIRKNFDLGKYIIVHLKKGKQIFEMVADPDEAWKAKKKIQQFRTQDNKDQIITVDDLKKQMNFELTEIFPTFDIFTSVKKGDRCTDEMLTEAFETIDLRNIATTFVLEGEFAWTKEQRSEWLDKKKKQIITIIARNCINPQTKKPHPPQRIEKAMEEARCSVDINKNAEEQIEQILRKIQVIIPIRMETIQMAIKVPGAYAAKAYNTVEKLAQIKQSEWQTDGSWVGMVSLPAGLQIELLEKLNNLTHGRVQTKLVSK